MMSIKNDQYHMLYFVVPKAACVSIRAILNPSNIHDTQNCSPDEYSHYFWFTFVRHPLDRMISLYYSMCSGHLEAPTKNILRSLQLDTIPDLYTFLWSIACTSDNVSDIHYKSQSLLFPASQMNFVGRFEHLHTDWNRLGLPPLPHHNKSDHKPWREYYYQHGKLRPIAQRLTDRYQEDMENFRYQKLN